MAWASENVLVQSAADTIGLTPLDLVLSDRHLRRRRADEVVAWLNALSHSYDQMLQNWAPSIIIGETANPSELLLAGLASTKSIDYIQPATTRIPADRFALWLGAHSSEPWRSSAPVQDTRMAANYLSQWLESPERPFYFSKNSRPPMFDRDSILGTLENLRVALTGGRSFAMQAPRPRDYFELPWLTKVKKIAYQRSVRGRSWTEPPPQTPYVFFPLHVQPEASVDCYPSIWRDQLALAAQLAASLLPLGIALVVKDHPNFVWSRGRRFHDLLTTTPNVMVVSPSTSSHDLMRTAVATFSISGTMRLGGGTAGPTRGNRQSHALAGASIGPATRSPQRNSLLLLRMLAQELMKSPRSRTGSPTTGPIHGMASSQMSTDFPTCLNRPTSMRCRPRSRSTEVPITSELGNV